MNKTSTQDPFIMMKNSKATGQILIPLKATVTKDEYNPISNIHTVMFNFWDELNSMVQHCLYEIDYENYKVSSCVKDGKFDWQDITMEELTKNE